MKEGASAPFFFALRCRANSNRDGWGHHHLEPKSVGDSSPTYSNL